MDAEYIEDRNTPGCEHANTGKLKAENKKT